MPGCDEALVNAWNSDNLGPPTRADVLLTFNATRKLFPNAAIVASTMDAFVTAVQVRNKPFRAQCSASGTSVRGFNGTEGRNPQGRTLPSPREPGAARVIAAPLSSVLTSVCLTPTLQPHAANLPLVTGEIADNWIYGTGSDPWKVAALRAAARSRSAYLANATQHAAVPGGSAEDPRVMNFTRQLLKGGEHTCTRHVSCPVVCVWVCTAGLARGLP